MVSLELLSSLDGLIWLQSGNKVGEIFHQHQTTVSRNLKKCSETFGLHVQKCGGSWIVEGDYELLNLERAVHQSARFQGKSPLRLEANVWINSILCSPPPAGWVTGTNPDHRIKSQQSLQLLHENIIDACLCPSLEAPRKNKELRVIDLCETPIQLFVSANHPLLASTNISIEQLKHYPFQRSLQRSQPGIVEKLKAINAWTSQHNNECKPALEQINQDGVDQTLYLNDSLAKGPETSNLVPLPLSLNAKTGISLVFKHCFDKHSRTRSLCGTLKKRLRQHQTADLSLQILDY